MRHLLLAAPLLALTAACTEPCTAPALTVSWRFVLPSGAASATCLAAGVSTVTLFVDAAKVGAAMDCEQGTATFTGLAAGAHSYTIQGHDAGGVLRYQTWGTVTVDGCGETRVLLQPGAGALRVEYATSTGTCATEAEPGNIGVVWYQLLDRSTGAVASSVNAVQTPTLLPCGTGDQGWFQVPLPWGLYRLRWIQVVTSPLATNPTPIYQYCPPLSPPPNPPIDVDVITTGVTTLTVPMAPPAGACIP